VKEILLIIGGCRSGKSRFALEYANKNFRRKVFLATGQALDDEMAERIRAHQEARGPDWTTIEEPVELARAVGSLENKYEVVLIDCMTLWINNLLMAGETQDEILSRTGSFLEMIQEVPQSIVVVSNEVGAGIVPANKIARVFRDTVGILNQRLAECSDVVVWTVAGLPQVIKGRLRAPIHKSGDVF
jgi:adenosylcobinamide kinase/adenosylcobinamide-phosphate guanylyltransferase